MTSLLALGAIAAAPNRCRFRVWAPDKKSVELHLLAPEERFVRLEPGADGYHRADLENVPAGSRYRYRLDGILERPDPASRSQPEGVHGPSLVTSPEFPWTDQAWFGLPLRDHVIYELHVGTFTPAGTFDAAIARLDALRELGVTALELMPVAQFPGSRNWGYDGVYPYAVQDTYGGPAGLKRLVNAAHRAGLAVILDVVYNHLGPEGNYLADFGPYFTDRYRTPWGLALNFDGPHSDDVRRFFLENALYWQTEFHLDGLRLDAVHAIRDFAPLPFLEELGEICHRQADRLNRRFHLIAESDMNLARHILPRALGGFGLDAQWSDDFHHSLHVLLTGENRGYYTDFSGLAPLAKVFREGYAYTGEYSRYRRHRHGSSPRLNPAKQFVVCAQNHDQIGNRATGDRLSASLSLEQLKLAAGAVLLSPFIPLLFMGEEYGETAPFPYFTSHSDPTLIEAVRKGRRTEFAAFGWGAEVPDPQAETTFERGKLRWDWPEHPAQASLRAYYRELLRLRRELPAIAEAEKETLQVERLEADHVLLLRYASPDPPVIVALCFADQALHCALELGRTPWRRLLESADTCWGGPGSRVPDFLPVQDATRVWLAPHSVLVLCGL